MPLPHKFVAVFQPPSRVCAGSIGAASESPPASASHALHPSLKDLAASTRAARLSSYATIFVLTCSSFISPSLNSAAAASSTAAPRIQNMTIEEVGCQPRRGNA
eukprot:712164-Pleurochrysis_carterae.AAC.1